MSVKWMELRDQFEIVLNQSNRSITRKFFMYNPDTDKGFDPTHAIDNLPNLGDVYPAWTNNWLPHYDGAVEFANCHVSEIKASPFSKNTDPIYTVTYSIDPPAYTLHNETLRMGYEYMMVQMATAENSTHYIGMNTNTLFDGTLRKLVMNADYTYTDYFATLEEATRFIIGNTVYFIADFEGKVLAECWIDEIPATTYTLTEDTNSKYYTVTGWNPTGKALDGNWLFNGCDITQYTDKTGQQKFMRTESYKYKRIFKGSAKIGETNANDCLTTGWNMVFNKFTGTFELTNPTTYDLAIKRWPRMMPDINGHWYTIEVHN
jgi:hypothetical protein